MQACTKYNQMMSERFVTFRFTTPMPPEMERQMDFPHCGRCAAAFYLQGVSPEASAGAASAPTRAASAPQPPQSAVSDLERLAHLHQVGALSADEFKAAKRQCLKL
jgi:hypothetical protein